MTESFPPENLTVHDQAWDAGAVGCGELVMHLRLQLERIPGQVLRVNACDPGAAEDIPAWCRMTGHELVRAEPAHRTWWIRARIRAPAR